MRHHRAVSLFLPLLALASAANAQVLRGKVSDGVTGTPVLAASVMVLNADTTVIASARTDRAGEFTIRPPAGEFLLLVERYGYQSTLSKPLGLASMDSLTFEIRLPPQAIDIAGLEVVAPPRNELDPSGFFQRQKLGWGHFVDPAEVERRKPTVVTDLLHAVPGLRLVPAGAGGWKVRMENRGRFCNPTVYLDRAIAEQGSSTPDGFTGRSRNLRSGVDIDRVINTRLVRAVEVYQSGAEAPPGFHPRGGPGGGDCGVIVLWTFAGVGG